LTRWQEQRAKELLRTRLDGSVTVTELASECGVPRHVFSTAFRRSIGLMPHQWLSQQRIENARELLASSVSLGEVAALCGFASEQQLLRELGQHSIQLRRHSRTKRVRARRLRS
jgi:transcriptional regulator GlxA family with amidase domain